MALEAHLVLTKSLERAALNLEQITWSAELIGRALLSRHLEFGFGADIVDHIPRLCVFEVNFHSD